MKICITRLYKSIQWDIRFVSPTIIILYIAIHFLMYIQYKQFSNILHQFLFGAKSNEQSLYQSHYNTRKHKNPFNFLKINKSNLNFLKSIKGMNYLELFNFSKIENILENCPINPVNQHPYLFVSLVSLKYLNNMKLCIQSAINHGIKKEEFMIFSLDIDSHKFLVNKGIQSLFLDISSIGSDWYSVGRIKQVIQYYFCSLGADILFFESDMIFTNNFSVTSQELINILNSGIDIIMTVETSTIDKENNMKNYLSFTFNIGIMLVKSTAATIRFFKRWIHESYDNKMWDQLAFNSILKRKCQIIEISQSKQNLIFNIQFKKDDPSLNLTVHLLNPIKYLLYANLDKMPNVFVPSKIDRLLNFAKEMNLIRPNIIHFVGVYGDEKFTFIQNLTLNDDSYEYHMNYLKYFFYTVKGFTNYN